MKITSILFSVILLTVISCGSKTDDITMTTAEINPLPECPDSPNCVRISYEVEDNLELVLNTLTESLEQMNATDISVDGNAIDAVFTIPVFGFKDDVSIVVNTKSDQTNVIHMRSASRIGYSDLGVNRARVKKIRSVYDRILKIQS